MFFTIFRHLYSDIFEHVIKYKRTKSVHRLIISLNRKITYIYYKNILEPLDFIISNHNFGLKSEKAFDHYYYFRLSVVQLLSHSKNRLLPKSVLACAFK